MGFILSGQVATLFPYLLYIIILYILIKKKPGHPGRHPSNPWAPTVSAGHPGWAEGGQLATFGHFFAIFDPKN
jgi:hypothetical protein